MAIDDFTCGRVLTLLEYENTVARVARTCGVSRSVVRAMAVRARGSGVQHWSRVLRKKAVSERRT